MLRDFDDLQQIGTQSSRAFESSGRRDLRREVSDTEQRDDRRRLVMRQRDNQRRMKREGTMWPIK